MRCIENSHMVGVNPTASIITLYANGLNTFHQKAVISKEQKTIAHCIMSFRSSKGTDVRMRKVSYRAGKCICKSHAAKGKD